MGWKGIRLDWDIMKYDHDESSIKNKNVRFGFGGGREKPWAFDLVIVGLLLRYLGSGLLRLRAQLRVMTIVSCTV